MTREKPAVAWYWWPVWMLLLGIGLVVFYGALTPAWMAFRGVAWLSERGLPRRA
jgi:hypothetical protein